MLNFYLKKFIFIIYMLVPFPTFADNVEGFSVEKLNIFITLNDDYTFTAVEEIQLKALTETGAQNISQMTFDFWPQSEEFELIEAYVQQGIYKTPVSKDQFFIRTSKAAESAPGFVNSKTATVVISKVKVGSTVYVKTQRKKIKPEPLGFYFFINSSFQSKKITVIIDAPKDLYLNYGVLNGFHVQEINQDGRRIISASIKSNSDIAPHEPHMLDSRDIFPLFSISSLSSWQELGKMFYEKHRKNLIINKHVKNISNKIVGEKKGLEAAKEIYYWVNENIRYLAVYLDPRRNYLANTPQEILDRGYGDCKDQVMITQALLKVQGIESYPALVYFGKSFVTLSIPTPVQFNHAILYIPEFDVFLDSTNQYQAFSQIDSLLMNKITVLGNKEGDVKYTSKRHSNDSVYTYFDNLKISQEGAMESNAVMISKGNLAAFNRNLLSIDDLKELSNTLLAYTSLGGVGEYKVSNLKALSEPLYVRASWVRDKLYTIGKKIYFSTPTGLNIVSIRALKQAILLPERKYPLYFPIINSLFDYTMDIPKGYIVKKLPEDISFKNKLGFLKSSYSAKGGVLKIKRHISMRSKIIRPDEYPAFLDLVYKALSEDGVIIELNFVGKAIRKQKETKL